MPRKMIFLIVLIIILIAGMFVLASLDTEKPLQPMEQPVTSGKQAG